MIAKAFLLMVCLLPAVGRAEENASALPSVADNIRSMDRDRDGMVSMAEIRTHLETQNGKGYRRELLDEMTVKASAQSCSSPFSRSFY